MTMFEKLRNKSGKQFVKKFQIPFGPLWSENSGVYKSQITGQLMGNMTLDSPDVTQLGLQPQKTELFTYGSENGAFGQTTVSATSTGIESYNSATGQTTTTPHNAEDTSNLKKGNQNGPADTIMSGGGEKPSGKGAQIASAAFQTADQMLMGDKNFGSQSEAIDTAVHGVSGALMKSGNPYAMIAGAALEGANFLTKAGGQTVQGFDVDINSSGYGDLGHMESSSSRDFGALIGLGGLFGQGKMKEKLAKRNVQAKMAMNAANIAEEQSFEQEARANSIQNTIMNNNIALAGGLDTSLLGG